MENNTKIGPIDRRIISRFIHEQGYETIKREIDEHEFETKMLLTGKNGDVLSLTEKDPFCMKFSCQNKNNSNLSKDIFSKIASRKKIDLCTTWKPTDNPDFVEVITKFYNKEALLTTLDTIHSRKNKNSQSRLMNISHRADRPTWREKNNATLTIPNPMYRHKEKINPQQEPTLSQNMVVPDLLEVNDLKVDDDIYSILDTVIEESPDAKRCLTCMSILCMLGYAFGIVQTVGQ